MTSSKLIGRPAELAELEAALRDAADGRPSLAFVAGESGVGKTRLVDELARRDARGRRARRVGDCVELGDDELPYAPLVGVLRSLARDGDPALDELPAPARAELAALLPELGGEARADAGGLAGPAAGVRGAADAARPARARAAARLVLEDIHWADRSTRAFLVFLARNLWTERVLVVATYRSDELHRRHPLRPLLAELERDTRARRIELARLTRDELAELLADILGGAPTTSSSTACTRAARATRCSPRSCWRPARRPRRCRATLRDALMVRIERLSEPAQEVLRVLSAGRRLSHACSPTPSGARRRRAARACARRRRRT